MDDERLVSELERRARSASPRSDWASRDLLPAVRREIEARPAVVTSRWPTGVSVAALVVALVVLVVAIPRLSPQPPGLSHSQSAFPTPTNPLSASGPTYVCTGPDWEGRAIELTDHLGVIESCLATRLDRSEERIVVSEISRGVIGVAWQGPCADGASLDLWSREDAQDRPRYVLTIESIPLDPPRDCLPIAGIAVEITFMNTELAPENLAADVEAHVIHGGRGSDRVETSAGEFHLGLSAGATQYSTADPIDIQAQLFYEGDQPTIDLSGVFSLVNGFRVEQLDGDLGMGPGWEEPCVLHQLQSGEPLTVPFEKSAGWGQDDPNADFYRDWSADPVLHLPAGTWLVTAYSDFVVGSGCSGERVDMQASIVLTVVDGPLQTPAPTSPPTAFPSASPQSATRTFACAESGALAGSEITLIDHSGLVSVCSIVQADTAPDGPIDVGIARLPNRIRATWVLSVGCPADDRLEFWGLADGPGLAEYVLQLSRERETQPEPAPLSCGDVLDVRQVEVEFVDVIRPEDILAISVDRSLGDGTVSNVASSGVFDLQLAASQAWEPNEPIDVTSRLTYHGTDPVTLSGWWRPDFAFTPLAGGPRFDSYGSLLLCPDAEVELAANEGVSGHLEGGSDLDPADPNYAYREEYAYDGQFRLPGGAYLIYTGVTLYVGADCSGELVRLWNAIVIEVGP